VIGVPGELGAALPGGGLRRGTVTRVAGVAGAGATTVALRIAAAVTSTGEWAVAVDPDGTLGGLASLEAGVAPERFALVRHVDRDRWPVVVGALLDGVTAVIAAVPRGVRAGDARRLAARTRERRALLVVMEAGARWPAEAALRLHARGDHVEVTGKGAAGRAHRAARAG
jgi:RecA/RadA recombinase